MTNISGIDAGSQIWQQDNSRSPAKDFAHELAKHDEQAKSSLQSEANSNQEAESESRAATDAGDPKQAVTAGQAATVASTQDAMIAAQSEAQQLARAIVAPTGIIEALLGARVFGWHAMAQAYLSELSATDDVARSRSSAGEQTPDFSPVSDEMTDAPIVNASPAAVAEEVAVTGPQAQTSQQPARLASDEAASPTTTEPVLADSGAASYWSERSLRFTRQSNGTSVAWLRDFRISGTEASRLIQLVLSDAKAKGVALSKIMLNGREAWTSPNNHQGVTHVG
jgi:hypothetical protein